MNQLPAELEELERIIDVLPPSARVEVLCRVPSGAGSLPVYAIDFGPDLPAASPAVMYVGGVHGLEAIGTRVLLSHLHSIRFAQSWDEHLTELLRRVRVVFVPLLNPAGVLQRRRSNGNGVDLMRNAPQDADERGAPWHLFRGHRLTPLLPWYRGRDDAAMEPEAQALCELVRRVVFPSEFALTLDVHSGFFGDDRLWFPYARTRRLVPNAPEFLALKDVVDQTYPSHRYTIEPQSTQYTTHGDLWDHLYDEHRRERPSATFMPLTLELSSSSWLRKNPRQIFDRRGMFHPFKQHRVVRLLRRHAHLLEAVLRLAVSHTRWLPRDEAHRELLAARARTLWAS